jgi:hypothetical protein
VKNHGDPSYAGTVFVLALFHNEAPRSKGQIPRAMIGLNIALPLWQPCPEGKPMNLW